MFATVDNDDLGGGGKPAAKYSAMEYVHRARSRLDKKKTRASLLDLPVQSPAVGSVAAASTNNRQMAPGG